jgi:hypothetical protein
MALPNANTAEGGTNGVTVTTGNSGGGSGDAFTDITIGTGYALIYDNAQAAHGSLAVKMTGPASPSNITRFGWANSVTEVYGRLYIYRTANPAGAALQCMTVDLSGTGSCGYMDINTTGNPRIFDSALTSSTFTNAITLNAWNRIEFRVLCGVGTGIVEAKLFLGDSTSVIETRTINSAQTRASMTHVFFGQYTVSDASGVTWFDDLQVNATGYPGPSVTGLTKTGFGAIG